jgi:uncharacterized protein involved in exopolysaccharide biosynthesis
MKIPRHWLWLLLTPALLGAATMFTVASFTPKRYRSEAAILVVPAQVPEAFVKSAVTTQVVERLQAIQQQILSRTRLEQLIEKHNLYPELRRSGIMEDVVERMRNDIDIAVFKGDAFKVGYQGTDPKTVMKVAENLAGLFIQESLKDREVLTEGTGQFLEGQVEDARRRFIDAQTKLESAAKMPNLSHAELAALALDVDLAKDFYKSLVMKKQESNLSTNLERRQIGEQFKLLDPARIPERPFAPNRQGMTTGGALIGFGVGLVIVLIASFRRS